MAEKITIEFGGERIEIPEFAMDSTLKTLVKVTKDSGIRQSKEAKDQKKSIENLMKELVGVNAKQRSKREIDAQDKTTDAVRKVGKKIEESSKAQKGLLGKLGGGTGSILGTVVSKFGKFGKMLNPVTAGLFGLFNAIKSVTEFLMKMGRLENTLFRRGFNFVDPDGRLANGIASLGAQATDASLSIDEFVELTSQFATAFGEFGTKTITDAIQNTQDLLKSQGFLGLSNSEMAQAVAEMSEQFRALGLNVEGQSQFLANQTVKVLQTTQAFTKLTNTSNDVIRQMVMQATTMEAFRNAMQMLPSEVRAGSVEASQVAFAGLAALGEDLGGQLTQALSEGIGRGGLQFTEFGQQLAGVSPVLLNSLQELSYAAGNNGDVVGALDNFRNAISEVDGNQRQFLRALEISGDPMAKFVIKLANMNETIDDNSFKQLAETMSEVKADQLGVAQTQLALAMARVRTAFQKLQIAFLTPETVAAFEWGVKKVVDMLTGFAEFLKTDLYGIINSFITSVAKGVKFLMGIFTGQEQAIGKVTNVATNAINATFNRVMAENIYGGDTKSELDKMDKLKANLDASKTKAEYDANLKKIHDYVFKTENFFGAEIPSLYGALMNNDRTNKEMENSLQSRLGKYGLNFKGFDPNISVNKPGGFDTGGVEQSNLLGAQPNRRNIRIMPMYGDLDDYVSDNQSPQVKQLIKINQNLSRQVELLEAQVNETAQVKEETKKSNVKLEALPGINDDSA